MFDAAARVAVIERAGHRCEYCLLLQRDHLWPFHVEHIVPRQHGGDDSPENLAFSCPRCNRYKGPNLTAIDPKTGQVTVLFNPRTQHWTVHFHVVDDRIEGITGSGRATVRLLRMNADSRRELRGEIEVQPAD